MDVTKPDRRQLIILAVILLIGLGLRSWHLTNHLMGPLAHQEEHATSSDMHAFTALAKKIAAGDVLCREGYHPYMDWMEQIAPIEKFEEWWGGKEIYHQTPLYPYLLAICYLIFNSNVPLLILQVLLTTVALWLLFDLGRQLLDVRTGLIAAGIAAVFAPSVVLDSIQLRASMNSSVSLLSIWLLLRLRHRGTARLGGLTGACLAASYLLRPTGLVLMTLGPLFLLIDRMSRPNWRRWVPAMAAAMVVVLAPFFVRNLIVGAPTFALSTRGPETVIQANSATADPGFMSTMPDAAYRQRMDDGHESITQALRVAIDTWPDGSLGWWLWHQWQRVGCVFGDYEYANNINFYWYRRLTPLLEFLPTFGWFVGLSMVGLVFLGICGRSRMALWIPLAAAGALFMGCLLGFALGRYRMPLAILLTIPAGAALSRSIGWIQGKHWLPAIATCATAMFVSVLSFQVIPKRTLLYDGGDFSVQSDADRQLFLAVIRRRPQEPTDAARALHRAGKTSDATELLAAYAGELSEFFDARKTGFRKTHNVSSYFLLLMHYQRSMSSVAVGFHELGAIEHRDAANARAIQLKREADALRGN